MNRNQGFAVYTNKTDCYHFPYDPETKSISDIDFRSLTSIPENIVVIQILNERSIDPVEFARLEGVDIKAFLKLNPIRNMEFVAKVIPWSRTTVPEIIQRNTGVKVPAVTVSKPKKMTRKRSRGI